MKKKLSWLFALMTAFALVAAACGSDTAEEVVDAGEEVVDDAVEEGEEVVEEAMEEGEEAMEDDVAMPGAGVSVTAAPEEYNITSMQQINDDPELVALFDEDGDGKADLFGCPEDWTCDDIMNDMISFNGWDNIAQVKAGYDGMIAESVNRANAGDPVMQYTWSPSGYLTQLIPGDNALWLSHGGEDKILDGSTNEAFDFVAGNPASLGDTCTEDPCWIGWDSADIQVTANKEFVEANPAAGELFSQVKLSVIDVANENVKYSNGEDTEDDVKRHAEEWIADNRELVDTWLDAARAAA